MKTARDTTLLFHRYTVQMLRNPVWLFVGFSTPLLYLVLFTPLLKHFSSAQAPTSSVIDLFLPGILALLAFASGMAGGFSTIFELQSGVIERFRVTPSSRLAILMGPLLSGMLMMFVFDAVVVAAAAGFGFTVNWLGLAALVVLLGILMVTMSAFSVATALVTQDISSFAAIVNGLNLPLLLLAGVLLPISLGPTWMQVLAHFNPLYYAVEGARSLSAGAFSNPAVWQAFAVLVPLCIVVVTWATRIFRQAVA
ncbi:MAG TPA: ABC transporter permease [Acidimicrobiales bacterium]|nr:ABC transporter permease [Acidimicrobiales bacterium]